MEIILTMIGEAPEGYEVLEYIVRSQIIMVFMGLAVYLVTNMLQGLINMTK